MKTDAWIDLLARDAGPAPRALAARRWAPAVGLGLLASAALAVFGFGPVPADFYGTAAPWTKMAYAAAVATAALWWAVRLGKPSAPTRPPRRAVWGVVALMLAVGLVATWSTPPTERWAVVFRPQWSGCALAILALSLPTLAAGLWALRGLAPTRPGWAGFAAGLVAGGVGAFGFALSCTAEAMAYIAFWYTAGIVAAGAVGALLGPRVLRW